MVVDNKSATLGLAGSRETFLTIDEDHSHLCKFAGDDDAFEPVGRGITNLAEAATAQARTLEITSLQQSQTVQDGM